MSVFTIADLHLSLSADKPMDIFPGWSDYVERLRENWLAAVSPEDTVVLPGDISWAMKLPDAYKDFEFINSLPGKKYILKGNHDLWWSSVSKMKRFFEDSGFDSLEIIHNNAFAAENMALCGTRGWFFDDTKSDKTVLLREAGRLRTSIEAALETGFTPVVFLHYPPVAGDRICEEIFEVLMHYDIRRCYYGHIHGSVGYKAVQGSYYGINLKLISADYLKFTPLKVEIT